MIKIRGIIIIAAALALAGFTATLISKQNRKTPIPDVACVTAAVDIQPGMKLSPERLEVVNFRPTQVPKNHFSSADQVKTRTALSYIKKGTILTEQDLTPEEPSAPDHPENIRPGMQAVSLKCNWISGLDGLLAPGDFVDIISVVPINKKKNQTISRIIISETRVLSVQTSDRSLGKKQTSDKLIITLELTPEDAKALAVSRQTDLKLVKTQPGDKNEGKSGPVVFSVFTGPQSTADLEKKDREADKKLSRLVKKEFRAVTVSLKDDDGICGFLRPGNIVDAVAVSSTGNIATKGRKPGDEGTLLQTDTMAKTILQKIKVIGVDLQSDSPAGWLKKKESGYRPSQDQSRGQTGQSVTSSEKKSETGRKDTSGTRRSGRIGKITLLLSPEDTEKFLVAYNTQQIKFIVRNPDDRQTITTDGEKLVTAFWGENNSHSVDVFYGPKEWGMEFPREEPSDHQPFGRIPEADSDYPISADNDI